MHNEVREKQVIRVVSQAPKSAQGSLIRAFSGAASPRKAIKAMCLCCMGFERKAVANCTGYSCPLWTYRPFQETA